MNIQLLMEALAQKETITPAILATYFVITHTYASVRILVRKFFLT